MEPCTVSRSIDLDISADDLWRTLVDVDRWPAWIGQTEGFEARPGDGGSLVEADGTRRRLLMEHVDHGKRLVWRWWPEDGQTAEDGLASQGSTVEVVVTSGGEGGSRLTVIETLSANADGRSRESVAWGWEIRLMHLAVLVLLLSAAAHLVR